MRKVRLQAANTRAAPRLEALCERGTAQQQVAVHPCSPQPHCPRAVPDCHPQRKRPAHLPSSEVIASPPCRACCKAPPQSQLPNQVSGCCPFASTHLPSSEVIASPPGCTLAAPERRRSTAKTTPATATTATTAATAMPAITPLPSPLLGAGLVLLAEGLRAACTADRLLPGMLAWVLFTAARLLAGRRVGAPCRRPARSVHSGAAAAEHA